MEKQGESQKGQLHKGPVTAPLKSVPGYKPVSSIPAKFETILYTGPREKKGFLAETRRFQEPENESPGPGSYNSKPVPLDQVRYESTGKKGYGPMASSSRRFSDRVCYTGPGPADYRRHSAALEDRGFSKAPASSAFQEKTTGSLVPLDRTTPHLGPGTYDGAGGVTRTGARVDYSSQRGATSAFKASSGHELILAGNMEAPASTSYDLGDPWDRTIGRGGGSRMGTSSFGAGGGRGGASVGSMTANLDTLLFGTPSVAAGKPDAGPGPGSYELQDFSSIRSKLSRQANRPSPQFFTADSSPNRQQPKQQVLVSPGDKVTHDYLKPTHHPLHSLSPTKGVSAPFRSRSAGHQEIIDQQSYYTSANAPGPAYYQPPTVIKKSFHKNSKQQYATVAF